MVTIFLTLPRLAITHNLPLKEWYYSNTSIWTLDYPPFFAYFEKTLSIVAERYNKTIVMLQEEPLMNDHVRIFQRVSVICTDFLYVSRSYSNRTFQLIASAVLSEAIVGSIAWGGASLKDRLKLGLFALMACNPGLVLLDNIHFQYNSMLYGILCLSIAKLQRGSPLMVLSDLYFRLHL